MVKDLPGRQDTWVQSLGLEDPLEEEMATHSSILAWKIPWTEEPGGLSFRHFANRTQPLNHSITMAIVTQLLLLNLQVYDSLSLPFTAHC